MWRTGSSQDAEPHRRATVWSMSAALTEHEHCQVVDPFAQFGTQTRVNDEDCEIIARYASRYSVMKPLDQTQSFDLLRQLRNFLVHYKPRLEVTDFISKEHYEKEAISLEHKVSGKFAFNEALAFKEESVKSNNFTHAAAFVYRCFSKDCARWSFEVGRDLVNWISETLSIEGPSPDDLWALGDDQ